MAKTYGGDGDRDSTSDSKFSSFVSLRSNQPLNVWTAGEQVQAAQQVPALAKVLYQRTEATGSFAKFVGGRGTTAVSAAMKTDGPLCEQFCTVRCGNGSCIKH